MIFSWNVGVQHALTSTVAVEANYIGNHGSRLTGVIDMNQISAANQAAGNGDGRTLPFLPLFLRRQQPVWHCVSLPEYIDYQMDNDISNYNALEVTLTARNFHNLSILAGYTFSKALSEEPGTGYGIATSAKSCEPDGGLRPHRLRRP